MAEKQGDLISNDTLRQVDGKLDEVSGTAWSQQLWVGFQKIIILSYPPIHLHLIFEISSSKNLVRITGFFVYFQLDFCRLHRQ